MSVLPLLSCLVVSGRRRRPDRLAATDCTLLTIYDVNVTTLFLIGTFLRRTLEPLFLFMLSWPGRASLADGWRRHEIFTKLFFF